MLAIIIPPFLLLEVHFLDHSCHPFIAPPQPFMNTFQMQNNFLRSSCFGCHWDPWSFQRNLVEEGPTKSSPSWALALDRAFPRGDDGLHYGVSAPSSLFDSLPYVFIAFITTGHIKCLLVLWLNLQEGKLYENKVFFAWLSAPSPIPSNGVQTVEIGKYVLSEFWSTHFWKNKQETTWVCVANESESLGYETSPYF